MQGKRAGSTGAGRGPAWHPQILATRDSVVPRRDGLPGPIRAVRPMNAGSREGGPAPSMGHGPPATSEQGPFDCTMGGLTRTRWSGASTLHLRPYTFSILAHDSPKQFHLALLWIAFRSEAEEGAFRRVARGAPPFPAPLRPAPLFEAGLPGQAGSSPPAHPPSKASSAGPKARWRPSRGLEPAGQSILDRHDLIFAVAMRNA